MDILEIAKKGDIALEQLVKDYGLEGAVLVSSDGLTLSSRMPAGGHADAEDLVAAACAATLSLAENSAEEVGKAPPEQVTLYSKDGYIVFTRMNTEVSLGVFTSNSAKLGITLNAVKSFIQRTR